ncbi:MAG: hypothetical protein ABIG39_02495 [Candidatus Micrarchaeota archaeon]
MLLSSKANLVKAGVILLVLVFLLQILGMQGGSNTQIDTGPDDQPGESTVLGIAFANATVTSYGGALGASISVGGTHPDLSDVVARMKEEGIVEYTSPRQNGMVLNLARDADISVVVKRLSNMNLTLVSIAELSFSEPVNFSTSSGPIEISVRAIRIELDPSIPIGYTLGLKITAAIYDGKIYGGKYDIIPLKARFLLRGEVSELFRECTAIGVLDWNKRSFDRNATEQYLSQDFDDVIISSILNNTVSFSREIAPELVEEIGDANITHILNIGTAGMLIQSNFTDAGQLESEMSPFLESENITLSYPLSYIRIDFRTDEHPEEFLNSSLDAIQFFIYRNMTVRINENVYDAQGAEYKVLSRDYTSILEYANETGIMRIITVEAQVIGNVIYNYTVIE